MKGLLLKDLLLLKNNKKLYAILVFFAVMYPMMGMGSFTITFLGMMGLIISISTMNYDEFDNGNSFLFSLAFTRNNYVAEKYVLCIGGGILGALLGALVCFAASKITGDPSLLEGMAENLCAAVLLYSLSSSVMLPIFIRFGAEKGRMASYLTLAAFFLLGFGVLKFLPASGKESLINAVTNIPVAAIVAGIALFAILAVCVSVFLSLRFIRMREF